MYVSVKAFGDLVIAVSMLERVVRPGDGPAAIIFGSHLSGLMAALDANVRSHCLPLKRSILPPLYDVRKAGPLAALSSALELRRAIADISSETEVLVFDRVGIRERMVAGDALIQALPAADNIYTAYALSLERFGLDLAPPVEIAKTRSGTIGIFPASRLERKNIPLPLLERLVHDLRISGMPATVFLLEGERPDIQASRIPHRVAPRTFESLIGLIGECSQIVSADSLPAHLAGRANVPVFVLSPEPNEYWLPQASFSSQAWGVFDEASMNRAVQRLGQMRIF